TEFVSQYQDPARIFVQHNQEGIGAPVVSLPVQGTVAADGVVAARQLTALVGGAPTTTITLRLAWAALRSRLLLRVDPSTLPAGRTPHTRAPGGTAHRGQNPGPPRSGLRPGGGGRPPPRGVPRALPPPAVVPAPPAVRTREDRYADLAAAGGAARRLRGGPGR